MPTALPPLNRPRTFGIRACGQTQALVYEAGGLNADELFRGQDPSIEPLLEGRGFIDTPSPDA